MMLLHYLKYFLFHAVGAAACAAIFAGGTWTPLGLVAILIYYVIGDAVFGDDRSTPKYGFPGLLTAQLWLALPLVSVIVFAMVWSVSSGDFGGVGKWIQDRTGFDVLAARAATNWWEHAAGIFLTILMIGICGTIPAHELTHRTWDPISMLVGRWLLAFSFDTHILKKTSCIQRT